MSDHRVLHRRLHRRLLAVALVVLLAQILAGCASLTNMTSARTLPANEVEFVFGLGFSDAKLDFDDAGETNVPIPGLDFMLRYGITDLDEVALRIATFGFFVADYKRAIISEGSVLMSVGVGLGATRYPEFDLDTTRDEVVTLIDVYLPLYFDFMLSDKVALLASPKYVFRNTYGPETDAPSLLGLSTGMKFGLQAGVLVEFAYAKEVSGARENIWQLMFSMFFH